MLFDLRNVRSLCSFYMTTTDGRNHFGDLSFHWIKRSAVETVLYDGVTSMRWLWAVRPGKEMQKSGSNKLVSTSKASTLHETRAADRKRSFQHKKPDDMLLPPPVLPRLPKMQTCSSSTGGSLEEGQQYDECNKKTGASAFMPN